MLPQEAPPRWSSRPRSRERRARPLRPTPLRGLPRPPHGHQQSTQARRRNRRLTRRPRPRLPPHRLLPGTVANELTRTGVFVRPDSTRSTHASDGERRHAHFLSREPAADASHCVDFRRRPTDTNSPQRSGGQTPPTDTRPLSGLLTRPTGTNSPHWPSGEESTGTPARDDGSRRRRASPSARWHQEP